MKKKDALILSPQIVDLIMNYISQILDNTNKISGIINFNSLKIDGQNVCTLDIYVPNNSFEKHINLEITTDHVDIMFEKFLDRVITDILPHETIGATRFYHLRSNSNLFDGITIINSIGSEMKVNMYGIDRDIVNEYNKRYDQYRNSLINEGNISKNKIK